LSPPVSISLFSDPMKIYPRKIDGKQKKYNPKVENKG
jgi:hypothetical protein